MNQKIKEILLNQLQLLQEESEKAREMQNDFDRPHNLAMLSEAMAHVASAAAAVTNCK